MHKEQGRGFSMLGGLLFALVLWQTQLSKKRGFLPILFPFVCEIQPASLRAKKYEKNIPKAQEEPWECLRN